MQLGSLQVHFSGGTPPRFTKVHTPVRAERVLRASSLVDAATQAPLAGACPPGSPTGSALLLLKQDISGNHHLCA